MSDSSRIGEHRMSSARDTAKDDGSVVCVVDPTDARARAGISRSVSDDGPQRFLR